METLLKRIQAQIDTPAFQKICLEKEEAQAIISLLKGGEWIPLRHEKDEIQEGIDVWLLRPDGEVVLSAKGDFIPLRTFTHYYIAKKPQPPTE